MLPIGNDSPFYLRLYQYQKERFPLVGNGILIAAFTFSAISYSRICRGVEGFIPVAHFALGIFATITLFLLVRIFDEFKDKDDDATYRNYLPVPRGLIRLEELGRLAWGIASIQLLAIFLFQPEMLLLYGLVLVYLLLMRVEFFVPTWLKNHQLAYVASHMLIIPLIDLYSSGLDWKVGGAEPHIGLVWFFAVSYVNGMVLEFGRKMRTPSTEEVGVVSYTGLYGTKGGPLVWLASMGLTLALALGASHYAGFGTMAYGVFMGLFILCSLPGWVFMSQPTRKTSKWMEYASALWTVMLYLVLGAFSMVQSVGT